MSEEKKEKELIHKQMIAVMADIGAIKKENENTFHNYKFRGVDDVYNAVQAALVKHKVFTLPRLFSEKSDIIEKGGGKIQVLRLFVMEYVFFAEDGSCVIAKVPGEGIDSGDKAGYKALAGAHKYALLQTFCIPTEEKKDAEHESPEREKPKKTTPKKEKATIKMTLTDGTETTQTKPKALQMFAKMKEKIGIETYDTILQINEIDDITKVSDIVLSKMWDEMIEAFHG